ncbi:MAG: hypothetical protein ABI407_02175, partial [Bradyrhizobium sp.]
TDAAAGAAFLFEPLADFFTVFLTTLVCGGVAPDLLALGFFDRFLAGFPAALFAALPVFFAAFLTACLPVWARFFAAEAWLARRDLRTFFAVRFVGVFFLAVATPNSFVAQIDLSGRTIRGAFTAWLPQAARTPRKPVVSVRDCRLRYRARRG